MARRFGTVEPTNSLEAGTTATARISADGTVVVPKELPAEAGLTEEQHAVARVGEGKLMIAAPQLVWELTLLLLCVPPNFRTVSVCRAWMP